MILVILNIRLEVVLTRRLLDFVILKLEMRIILNIGPVLEKWFLFFLSLA